MTQFDDELRKALAPREPSADFTARVLAKVQAEPRSWNWRNGFWQWLHAMRAWRIAAVAAAFLAMTGGTLYQQHEREVRGEAAKRQLVLALRIAGSKLRNAQQRVVQMESTEVQ